MSPAKGSIDKLHTQWKQDRFFEIYPWRKIPNQAFNRHTPPLTAKSTTNVKTGLRHLQRLRFGGWKRKPTNTRTSHSTHKVAQRLKKVGCSPQLPDLSLKTNSSNYNSKVQLLHHNYCGEGGCGVGWQAWILFMSHMLYAFLGWKRQNLQKTTQRTSLWP